MFNLQATCSWAVLTLQLPPALHDRGGSSASALLSSLASSLSTN